jgi:hypothetical protein
MHATEALKISLESTQFLLGMYLSDLSDADFLVRPVPGSNHIAWQLGHLIASEQNLVKSVIPEAHYPELPAGFAEQHKPDKAALDPPKGFATKAEYLDLFTKTREATKALVAKMSDADLDRPSSGRMAQFAPTLGAFIILVANHTLMHAGQFTAVRRKLGKPVLF